ncbi:MAG: insulinase family protein [Alphaproteobacteria bacterium]|nr:insulinase family protein [Alphaproteobacteria bacterium]
MLTRILVVLVALLAWAPAWSPAWAVTIQRVISPGGIEAWLVEDKTVPIIALDVSWRGGSALVPAEKRGIAEMAMELLDEGAGPHDSQAFKRQLEDLSISLSFSAHLETVSGGLSTLRDNRETAFALMRLALTEPRFDQDAIDRLRDQKLSGLVQSAQQPRTIANRAWWRSVFPEHPYGRQASTAETLKRVVADDLRRFVRDRLARDNIMLGVVGDISADELRPLLDRTFGGLPATSVPAEVPAVTPAARGDVMVVRRGVPQSVVTFGHGGIKRDDPDWYAAHVMNHLMGGGGFTSRLMREVREKRGLAYGVSTGLVPMDQAAAIVGTVATENSRVAQSIEIIKAEWARFAAEGPSQQELDEGKTYLTGSFALQFDTARRVAGILVSIQRDRLGIDYISERNRLIERVTIEDVRRVAKRLLDPANLTFVVIGEPQGVSPTREAPTPEG